MALSDIINVVITSTSVGVTQAGFGIPLILSCNAAWLSERIRFYSNMTEVFTDFATTTPEYKAANAIFSQEIHPTRIAIGRLANKPTQKRTITPVVANNTAYRITVGTVQFTYTSDADATLAEIVAGLIAAINAGTDTLTATGTTTLVLTGNSAGAWDNVEVENPDLLSLANDHVDPGVAADLAAIKVVNDTWYGLVNPWPSRLMTLAIAAWVESNNKLFIQGTSDSEIITVAEGSATDVAKTAKTSAYFRTHVFYHHSPGQFAGAALLGRVLPLDPGSETWAFKVLRGVTASSLSTTHRTNALAKNAGIYTTVAGVNITEEGKVASGEWIDVVRFRDWLVARLQEKNFGSLVSNAKIPYTDPGVAGIAGNTRSVLKDGVEAGGLESWQVAVGKVKDANSADKTARILRLVNFTAVLAGAIHAVVINGTVGN